MDDPYGLNVNVFWAEGFWNDLATSEFIIFHQYQLKTFNLIVQKIIGLIHWCHEICESVILLIQFIYGNRAQWIQWAVAVAVASCKSRLWNILNFFKLLECISKIVSCIFSVRNIRQLGLRWQKSFYYSSSNWTLNNCK